MDNLAVSGSAKDEMKVNKCAFSNNAINVKNDLATIVNHNPNPSIFQHMTDVDGSRPVGYICLICFTLYYKLHEDALPPPLFLSTYVIYLWYTV